MEMILMFAVVFGAMYFLMIRPQQKQKKKAMEMRNSLAVGDEITTIGGMVGKVVSVKDDFLTFETGEDRVRIRVAKWAISRQGKASEEVEDQVQTNA